MCGRYSVLTEEEVIQVREIIRTWALKFARDEFEGDEDGRQEVFPTNHAPIVSSINGEAAFESAQFGFSKWGDAKGVIINARCESIKDKPMFKGHADKNRCVVPASGYFEWKYAEVEDGKKKGKSIKHQMRDKDGNLLFFAGLYRDGKDGREFVVITKAPVGDVREVHDRMPVILRTDQLEAWLSGQMAIEELSSLEFDVSVEQCEEAVKKARKDEDDGQLSLI